MSSSSDYEPPTAKPKPKLSKKTTTTTTTIKKRKKFTQIQTETTTTTTTTTRTRTQKSKGKKMYDKIGQKKDKPGDMEGIFIYYDTLYKEDPNSEMAEKWLLEHGCFDNKTQKILAKKYGKDKITPKPKSKKKNTKKKRSEE
eukprot:853717_1